MSGVYLLKGSDPVLLAEAARETVKRLVGDDDAAEVVDELSGDDYELGSAVMAATTISMFGDRVIVARNCGRFGAEDLAPVYTYLEDPSPDSSLVLVWDKPLAAGARTSAVPKKLTDAVKAAGGEVIETGVPGGKGRTMWVDDVIGASSVRLSNRAKRELVDRLGRRREPTGRNPHRVGGHVRRRGGAARTGRHRAVRRRGGLGATVGADRRHRRGPGRRLGSVRAANGPRRRSPPAAGHGDPDHPRRADAPTRWQRRGGRA